MSTMHVVNCNYTVKNIIKRKKKSVKSERIDIRSREEKKGNDLETEF